MLRSLILMTGILHIILEPPNNLCLLLVNLLPILAILYQVKSILLPDFLQGHHKEIQELIQALTQFLKLLSFQGDQGSSVQPQQSKYQLQILLEFRWGDSPPTIWFRISSDKAASLW